MLRINLKAQNGQYLCAEGGGGKELVANRNSADEWEKFWIAKKDKTPLRSNEKINLIGINHQYICAEQGGGGKVMVNRSSASDWETFTILKVDKRTFAVESGEIRDGDYVALRSHKGQYLCAEGGGGKEVVANRSKINSWESFSISFIDRDITLICSGNRKDKVSKGYMKTNFSVDNKGDLRAQTHIWADDSLAGFTGSVAIILIDSSGNEIWRSKVMTFGVTGNIPATVFSRSEDRKENWQDQVAIDKLGLIQGYAIVQTPDPHNRLIDILSSSEAQVIIAAIKVIFEEDEEAQ